MDGPKKKKKKTLEHILVERVEEKKTCMIFLRINRLNVLIWMMKKNQFQMWLSKTPLFIYGPNQVSKSQTFSNLRDAHYHKSVYN